MVHILVVGASQGIGQAVCQAAVANGHTVRAMSRSGRMPGNVSRTWSLLVLVAQTNTGPSPPQVTPVLPGTGVTCGGDGPVFVCAITGLITTRFC